MWDHLRSSGIIWVWDHLKSSGLISARLGSSGNIWDQLNSSGIIWAHMGSSSVPIPAHRGSSKLMHGTIWDDLGSPGISWGSAIIWDHLSSSATINCNTSYSKCKISCVSSILQNVFEGKCHQIMYIAPDGLPYLAAREWAPSPPAPLPTPPAPQ